MAKNDYFVIVYRILKYLYSKFMEGEDAELDVFGPDALKINNGYWTNVIESMLKDGYIEGVVVIPRLGGAPDVRVDNIRITSKGIEYLQENSMMKKAKVVLKGINEFKGFIPGL